MSKTRSCSWPLSSELLELVWISYASSKWRFYQSVNDHVGALPPWLPPSCRMLIIVSRMANQFLSLQSTLLNIWPWVHSWIHPLIHHPIVGVHLKIKHWIRQIHLELCISLDILKLRHVVMLMDLMIEMIETNIKHKHVSCNEHIFARCKFCW